MKTHINPTTKAYLIRGTFYLLLLVSVSTIPFALGSWQAHAQRTLTFAQRVAYQRAIEDVYWRHRIWPKERPDAKPPLDAVMSQEKLEKKVADYLRNSQALEDYWQRPITADQLQAEMDRMAKHTKQPDVLRELFEALDNDPFVIAECLARPVLAERLLTNWYTYDQSMHGELRQRADVELKAHPTVEEMKRTSGKYIQIELVKSDRADEEVNRGTGHSVKVNSREWDETLQKLAVTFNKASNAIDFSVRRYVTASKSADTLLYSNDAAAKTCDAVPVGVVSPLQEDKERYYATAVIERTNDRLKLGTVAWLKEPLESWLAKVEDQTPNLTPVVAANYTLPKVSDGMDGCIEDTWAAIVVNVPSGRSGHTAVWTGSEMIVWGGSGHEEGVGGIDTGWRYNPATDSWTATTTVNAPSARKQHTAVWTGSEMIVWGGAHDTALYTGGSYDPSIDSWTATSIANVPAGRSYHSAVWTGSEMIIWGGSGQGTDLNTGWKYNPNVTSPPTPTPTPLPYLNTGGRYNPKTDSWTGMSTGNTPDSRAFHTAVWTGKDMIVWGGTGQFPMNTGGKYNPNTDVWTATSTTNAPTGRDLHTGVWTGGEMIVWGGSDRFGDGLNTGGRYNPDIDNWTATSTVNAPVGRYDHTSIWTGNEMIVWGGSAYPSLFNSGGRYDPATDSWIATSTSSAPSGRELHTAVWTGSEMIVWGGNNGDLTNTGGRCNRNLDSWVATADATQERFGHTAVWTGSEMIVWGGGFSGFNRGGREE